MSTIVAVADDRYRKRPAYYETLAYHVQNCAKSKNAKSLCLYFTRDRAVPQLIKSTFDTVITADTRFLTFDTDLSQLFAHILKDISVSMIFALHHDKLLSFFLPLSSDHSHVYLDVCEIDSQKESVTVYMPRMAFSRYESAQVKGGGIVFIRALATVHVAEKRDSAEVRHFPFRFGKKASRSPLAVSTNFSIITGAEIRDKKYFIRYTKAIGDKMKGASLATESLCSVDNSIHENSSAEVLPEIETDFSVVVGDAGNYDLLSCALAQKYVVYVDNRRYSPLHLVADLVISEDPLDFLYHYNQKMKKIAFKPKKINKKL